MIKERTSNAIAQAVQALRFEEQSLTEQISDLQKRLTNVRSAFASMRTLLETDVDKGPNPAQVTLALDSSENSPYSGLPFSKALFKFMSTIPKPVTVREIKEGMIESGYKFNSDNEATQVYVGLKRNMGKLYGMSSDNKWIPLSLAFANKSN